jgi:two-component system OmpR family response regulator
MQKHIAIVEDEAAIAANYCETLQKQGFRVTVYATRDNAAQAFSKELPDLAIIDVGLGEEMEGGFSLCADLRSRSTKLPIIFLTARDAEVDIISGLRLGANDYLTKDISQAQLVARIFALFNWVKAHSTPVQQDDILKQGPLELNRERMTTVWKESVVELTHTEFCMVCYLAKNPGHVKSRQQLMDSADVTLDNNTITSHIKRIRGKFRAIDVNFAALETAHGFGYRWSGNSV